jgi:hypothetical protein
MSAFAVWTWYSVLGGLMKSTADQFALPCPGFKTMRVALN